MNDIVQAVSLIGFPSVMCLVLLYVLVKTSEQQKDFIATIDENTKAMGELKTVMDVIMEHFINEGGDK